MCSFLEARLSLAASCLAYKKTVLMDKYVHFMYVSRGTCICLVYEHVSVLVLLPKDGQKKMIENKRNRNLRSYSFSFLLLGDGLLLARTVAANRDRSQVQCSHTSRPCTANSYLLMGEGPRAGLKKGSSTVQKKAFQD